MQASILIAASRSAPDISAAIAEGGGFSVIEAGWPEASAIVSSDRPDAIVAVADETAQQDITALADAAGRISPYVPMIAAGAWAPSRMNVLPFTARLQDIDHVFIHLSNSRSAFNPRGCPIPF